MTTDELDPFEPKEQSKSAAPRASTARSVSPDDTASVSPDTTDSPSKRSASTSVAAKRQSHLRNPLAGATVHPSFDPRAAGFALAFGVGAIAALLLVTAAAMGLSSGYSNRVIPGVHVGSVDVSGLSRNEVIAKLQSSYAYLGQGQVTVTTPVGTATITYQQVGRGPDLEVMADAAISVGHTGSPIGDAASILRSAIAGQSVPVVVQVDPMALATRVHQLVGTSVLPPQDAQVTLTGGTLALSPSTGGSGIDEMAISRDIIDRLTQPDAPADLLAGGTFVKLGPRVSDKNAQDAIAAAQKMVVDVTLVWSGAPPAQSPAPSQSAAPVRSQAPPKNFTIDAPTIRGWIVFGTKPDGSYGPAADPALVQAYLFQLSSRVAIPPEEPKVIPDPSTGAPVGVKGGRDGTGIDVGATAQAIEAYLDSLVSGGNPGSTIAIVTTPIHPRISVESLQGMVKIGRGAWTTTFFPDVSNGNGVNIRKPATLLNGQVVGPGQQFSFLQAVGPIDAAHGWAMGGVIQGGKSNHTGAMGGGICSASTTMFNAAARAGLQIDERHAHFYYINRYPVGLDATVYSNGVETWDLRWTNDTPYPIVIIARTTPGSRSTITIELWSRPIDRNVAFTGQVKSNVATATDGKQYVSTLKPGQQNRAEYPTDGFDTSATRTVTDSTGKVIHTDTWKSHYTRVDGVLQIGGSPPPSETPTPSPGAPTPTPAPPTPTPTPAPAVPPPPVVTPAPPAGRRRKIL